eukprot:2047606-Pyramimonas_sp.AAC.1
MALTILPIVTCWMRGAEALARAPMRGSPTGVWAPCVGDGHGCCGCGPGRPLRRGWLPWRVDASLAR